MKIQNTFVLLTEKTLHSWIWPLGSSPDFYLSTRSDLLLNKEHVVRRTFKRLWVGIKFRKMYSIHYYTTNTRNFPPHFFFVRGKESWWTLRRRLLLRILYACLIIVCIPLCALGTKWKRAFSLLLPPAGQVHTERAKGVLYSALYGAGNKNLL